jgi:hypothetical protein
VGESRHVDLVSDWGPDGAPAKRLGRKRARHNVAAIVHGADALTRVVRAAESPAFASRSQTVAPLGEFRQMIL